MPIATPLYAMNSAALERIVGTGMSGGAGGGVRCACQSVDATVSTSAGAWRQPVSRALAHHTFGSFRWALARFFMQDFQCILSELVPKSRPQRWQVKTGRCSLKSLASTSVSPCSAARAHRSSVNASRYHGSRCRLDCNVRSRFTALTGARDLDRFTTPPPLERASPQLRWCTMSDSGSNRLRCRV